MRWLPFSRRSARRREKSHADKEKIAVPRPGEHVRMGVTQASRVSVGPVAHCFLLNKYLVRPTLERSWFRRVSSQWLTVRSKLSFTLRFFFLSCASFFYFFFLHVCLVSAPRRHRYRRSCGRRESIKRAIGDDRISGWVAREFFGPPMLSVIWNDLFATQSFFEMIYWVRNRITLGFLTKLVLLAYFAEM